VLRDVALAEEQTAIGIEARGQEHGGGVVGARPQLGRVIRHRGGVQIDDAVDRRIPAILARDVLADRPDVVAEVLAARGLDAGEDAHGGAGYCRAFTPSDTRGRACRD
jgi:hypothetical protein